MRYRNISALLLAGATGLALALPVPAQAATLTATDVAGQAGVASTTNDSYANSLVFDYNRDGVDDLLLSNHMNAPAEIFRGNADGTFTLVQQLPVDDHHSCASADFNADGLPDFYCTIGADKGTATNKSNELWLQVPAPPPGGPTFVTVPGAWGANDAMGRGRDVAAGDFNNDGLPDLYVGNGFPVSSTNPSPNRLFLNTGQSSFTDATAELGALKSGGICVVPGDYNGDGRLDVFVCGRNNHLYLNKGGSFTDVAKKLALTQEWDNGAAWGDLNGDGHLDLVTVGNTALRVFLGTGTGFTNPYTVTLQAGRNVAITDADQDGHPDIYVVQGRPNNRGPNLPDLLLLGAGDGVTFTSFGGLPQVTAGGGNDVSVLSHFPNGNRPALLVTNGADGIYTFMGPRQLIEFGS